MCVVEVLVTMEISKMVTMLHLPHINLSPVTMLQLPHINLLPFMSSVCEKIKTGISSGNGSRSRSGRQKHIVKLWA